MVARTVRRKVRLSVTVSPELKALAEEIADETHSTASGVISQCLEEIAKKRFDRLMEDGYREMAEENLALAEKSFPIAFETLSK